MIVAVPTFPKSWTTFTGRPAGSWPRSRTHPLMGAQFSPCVAWEGQLINTATRVALGGSRISRVEEKKYKEGRVLTSRHPDKILIYASKTTSAGRAALASLAFGTPCCRAACRARCKRAGWCHMRCLWRYYTRLERLFRVVQSHTFTPARGYTVVTSKSFDGPGWAVKCWLGGGD